MMLTVEQVQSGFGSRFRIRSDQGTAYLAGTPWAGLSLPLAAERAQTCVLTSPSGALLYHTDYSFAENLASSIPLKRLFTKERKSQIYAVRDGADRSIGRFYRLTTGLLNTHYVVEFGGSLLDCYDVSRGRTRHIAVYLNGVQIAEIVKPLRVVNNLDLYYLFLLDSHRYLERILSFFTVVFDFQNYPRSGQLFRGTRTEIEYTYSKNNKYYNKKWLSSHFPSSQVKAALKGQI